MAESEESAELHNDPALRELTEAVKAGYGHGGDRGLLKALFAKAESCESTTGAPRVERAFSCVRLGRNQEVLQLLEEASANHDPNLADWFSAGALPGWRPIEDEPRFQAVQKRISGEAAQTQALAGSAAPSDSARLRAASEQRRDFKVPIFVEE